MDKISVESIIASGDRKPYVHLRWGNMAGALTPQEAREHALILLACSEAAESDRFVLEFFMSLPDATEKDGMQCLKAFRDFRIALEKEQSSSGEP